MISAFAKAAQILDEPRYLEAAQRAGEFHSDEYVRRQARVCCSAAIATATPPSPVFLDDYAFFIGALLDLYETDFDPRHIEIAMAPHRQNARPVRGPSRRRVLQHRRRRQQPGIAHEGRLRRRRAIRKRHGALDLLAWRTSPIAGLSRSRRANSERARSENH